MKSENLPEKIENKIVENLILEVRGMHVMLDSVVAFFFNETVSRVNQQMNRNKNRFPEDFCFRLNSKEFKNLRLQNAIFRKATTGRKYAPYMYSEHGIITLAGVLKSDIAAQASIEISRKFVEMRKTLLANSDLLLMATETKKELLEFENETNKRFDEIYRWKDEQDLPVDKVIAEGKYFDAFDYITNLVNQANENIVLVDPYCDKKALVYMNHKKVDVSLTIYKGPRSKLKDEEIALYEAQNGEIKVINKEPMHDRYLILDQNDCFLISTSLNSAGKSLMSIIKIELESAKKEITEEYPL